MMMNKIVILANGAFPTSIKLLQLLDSAEQIICCDGAVNKLVDSGREPSVIIGDLDSLRAEIKTKYKERLVHITEQDTNDLTKAVNWCASQGLVNVDILGATGEREDHTIANIALLSKYQEQIKVRILTDNGVFIPISKTITFDSFSGQQVSIFSQDVETEISSEGLKYPLQNLKLNRWWMGTLNESVSEEFTIQFNGKGKVTVYLLNE